MESLFMAMQNAQIHNQPIHPISIYIVFRLLLSDVLDTRVVATIDPDRTVISKLTLAFVTLPAGSRRWEGAFGLTC